MAFGTKRDTDRLKQLQAQIISMQKQIGWTHIQLANVIYCELHDEDDDELMRKFAETLKKQLKRDTTPPELLQRYIKLMINHDDLKKAALVVANPIRLGVVDFQVLRGVSMSSQQRINDLELNE